jgi:hypothetical protein
MEEQGESVFVLGKSWRCMWLQDGGWMVLLVSGQPLRPALTQGFRSHLETEQPRGSCCYPWLLPGPAASVCRAPTFPSLDSEGILDSEWPVHDQCLTVTASWSPPHDTTHRSLHSCANSQHCKGEPSPKVSSPRGWATCVFSTLPRNLRSAPALPAVSCFGFQSCFPGFRAAL